MEPGNYSAGISKGAGGKVIDISDVLAELGANPNPEGFTLSELSDVSGRSKDWCRKHLVQSGKLKYAGQSRRTRIDGYACWLPVYEIVQ